MRTLANLSSSKPHEISYVSVWSEQIANAWLIMYVRFLYMYVYFI